MNLVGTFLRALGRAHTYNLFRNPEAWFGLFWGVPIPVFALVLDTTLVAGADRSIARILAEHPWQLLFLSHPLFFAIVFGAMGTVRRDLEEGNLQLIARLEREASTDPLTGVRNRRHVMEELSNALSRAERTGDPLAVVMFDMDNFKAVNDTQGHLAGDRLLKDVATGLRDSLRQGDVLGRYGGDEFLLVAPGTREGAVAVAERARQTVKERTGHTISAGVSLSGANGHTPAELIGAADAELAERKKERKAAKR